MKQNETVKASPSAVKEATAMWNNFVKVATISGGITATILLLMAIFLV